MQLNTLSKKDASEGFTLIEVLVVVIMAGVLAAIAAPSWLGYLSRQRMNAVQSDLVQVLSKTQTQASQLRADQAITIQKMPPTVRINGAPAETLGSGTESVQLEAFTKVNNAWTPTTQPLTFNYQGLPKEGSTAASVPIVYKITATGGTAKKCVVVASILGTIKTADGATCDNPPGL